MNYAQIRKYDVANGPGIRTNIFVSGCTHNCPNCFNQDYMNFSYGKVFGDDELNMLSENLALEEISGLTVLGGEPLQQNLKEFGEIIEKLREKSSKSFWIYSGYSFEEILENEEMLDFLKYFDVLVDGRYVDALRDLTLKFRGSSNQRILNLKESLKNKKAVIVEEFR